MSDASNTPEAFISASHDRFRRNEQNQPSADTSAAPSSGGSQERPQQEENHPPATGRRNSAFLRKKRLPKTVAGITSAEHRTIETLKARWREEKAAVDLILDNPRAGHEDGPAVMPAGAFVLAQNQVAFSYQRVLRLRKNIARVSEAEAKDDLVHTIVRANEADIEVLKMLSEIIRNGKLDELKTLLAGSLRSKPDRTPDADS